MPDTWTLVTPAGPYVLNPTFAAPKYRPGGVDTNALQARPGGAFARVGDGLPTPGPLTLTGRVWRDDRDQAAIANELSGVRAAVRACTAVTRSNRGGTYAYEGIAGGPPPEVTPDGHGGWFVTIELWPGRAEPTWLPPPIEGIVFRDDFTGYAVNSLLPPSLYKGDASTIAIVESGDQYGLGKNVLRYARADLPGSSTTYYVAGPVDPIGMRATARVWTGLATSPARRISTGIYADANSPHAGLEASLLHGGAFALTRASSGATVEILASSPIPWALTAWYELEVLWLAGELTGRLRNGDGSPIAEISVEVSTPPAGVHASVGLTAENNVNQRVAWDWWEFEHMR